MTSHGGRRPVWRANAWLLAASSASLACLQLGPVWYELLDASKADRYFLPDFPRATFVAALVSFVLLASFLFVVAMLFREERFAPLHRLAAPVLLVSLLNPLTINGFYLFDRRSTLALYATWNGSPWLLVVAGAFGLGVLVLAAVRYGPSLRIAGWLLLALSPLAAFRVAETVHAALSEPAPKCSSVPVTPSARESLRRVAILVFDELDQRATFEARPADLELPEIDALERRSFSARRMATAGPNTIEAVPGMTTGTRVVEAEPASAGSLLVRFEGRPDFERWEEAPTLFHEARQRGARIGIVGFYHDYCRLFAPVIRSCRLLYLGTVQVERETRGASVVPLVKAQLASIDPLFRRRNAIEAYRRSLVYAREAVADDSLDLVYLHVPVPHEPFLYDRRRRHLTSTRFSLDGYFGNLVLVDRFLGGLRKTLEERGLWEETALVVTGDHAWRASKYYDGRHDDRVVFLVKPPRCHERSVYDEPVRATCLRDLVLGLLDGRLRDTAGVNAFLDGRRGE